MKPKLRLIISLAVFLLSLLAVSQLAMVSNMEEMLSDDSPSLAASKDFEQYFDGADQAIILVKQKENTNTFDAEAQAFLDELYDILNGRDYIDSILYKLNYDEIMPYAWAYADIELYEEIDKAIENNDYETIANILDDVQSQTNKTAEESGEYIINESKTHYMMIIKPILSDEDFLTSRTVFYDGTKGVIEELLAQDKYQKIDAGLTGGAFIQDIEADGVALDGLFGTMAVTLLLILLVLVLFFRNIKLPLLSIYPLVLGAVMAAAFAYIIYRYLNMFAISFALLLLGLGIDFAVHLLTRYKEERTGDINQIDAVKISVKSTGSSIIFGAVTTALAFAAFAFAKFKAFEQMGVISAIGLICLCAGMLTLVPAIILVFDKKPPKDRHKDVELNWLKTTSEFLTKRPWIVLIVIFAAIGAFFINVKNTEIQSDMNSVYPDDIPSLHLAQEIEDVFDYNTETVSIYGDNEDELKTFIDNLEGRDGIKQIDSIFDYMPTEQDEKLRIIKELEKLLNMLGNDTLNQFTLEEMTIDDLPSSIKDNYMGKDGRLRAEIIPNIDMYEQTDYEEFTRAIYESTGRDSVGMPNLYNEITQVVKEDIIKISIFCFVIVFVIALVIFRKLKNALLTVTPLLLTLYTTLGLLPILGIEINVFSIAAFPLIISIGIDSAIHLIHRLNEQSEQTISNRVMHTGKAIILTAITTMIGFGSLGTINHPGMANLGLTVAVGIGISMIYTLLVIPAFHSFLSNGKNKEQI